MVTYPPNNSRTQERLSLSSLLKYHYSAFITWVLVVIHTQSLPIFTLLRKFSQAFMVTNPKTS